MDELLTKRFLHRMPPDKWQSIPRGALTHIVHLMDTRAGFPRIELTLSNDYKMVRKRLDVDWSEWSKRQDNLFKRKKF